MARAAWAAKAQLIGRLRPYVETTAILGLAPLDLVPEVCGVLRSFTSTELRLVLAAYSGHDANLPALRLQPTVGAANCSGQSTDSVARLADVLVQLLVGGSRLGTAEQLLATATSVADHAPCECRAATDFWPVFAERVVRLSSGNGLDAQQLLQVLVVCSAWERRCGAMASRRSSGGAWGHMLRSVGGRLADPKYMDALELTEVVHALRHAARLGEPQYRLAASAGLRVGASAADLSARDLVAMIGAAGRLGGRLHMMTRALADELEPQVPHLPAELLVQLCTNLGALEMFPQRVAAALEVALPQRIGELTTPRLLQLMRAGGRLRWRVPAVLGPLLECLRTEHHLESMAHASLGALLYDLYRLDLWDADLIEAICGRLATQGGRAVSHKTAANVLLALSYFSYPAPVLYTRFVHELLRTQELAPEALYQVKTFEMAVRVGHAAVTFDDLGKLASRWLFGIRTSGAPPEPRTESDFADDVSSVARHISWRHESEVEVGPYLLDFAAVVEPSEAPSKAAARSPSAGLARICVALEADGPSHFYRPHGRPWHWTSASKLRHRLLTVAGIRVAHVPYYEWAQLDNEEEKEAYLTELLHKAHQQVPGPPWRRAALHSQTTDARQRTAAAA